MKSCRYFKTAAHTIHRETIIEGPHDVAALVRTTLYHSIMAPKILQESQTLQDACTKLASYPSSHPPPPPGMPVISHSKMYNSALDYLRSPKQQQLSQLPPCPPHRIARSSQEIEGKSAPEELQTHRRPFLTEALNNVDGLPYARGGTILLQFFYSNVLRPPVLCILYPKSSNIVSALILHVLTRSQTNEGLVVPKRNLGP